MNKCEQSGKMILHDKHEANYFIKKMAHEVKLRYYTCPHCNGIHLTKLHKSFKETPVRLNHFKDFKKYLQ